MSIVTTKGASVLHHAGVWDDVGWARCPFCEVSSILFAAVELGLHDQNGLQLKETLEVSH